MAHAGRDTVPPQRRGAVAVATGGKGGMVGKQGRVTGAIGPGLVGEVLIAVRGGMEAFYAHAVESDLRIPVGTRVLVMEYLPPRMVYVTPLT